MAAAAGGATLSRAEAAVYWTLALLPFLLLVVLNWGPGPPADATDAYHYLLHGRALAEESEFSNTGYIFSVLNHWIGPRTQPPGMAIFLYPAFSLFGANVFLMRLMVAACAIGFLLLAGRSFARLDGLHFGLSVTMLVGLVPFMAAFAGHIYSDLVSAVLLWAVVYEVDSERPFDAKKLALITGLGAMAMLTRLTGVALIGGLLLFAAARYRDFGWLPLVPVAIWSFAGAAALLAFGAVIPVWALGGLPTLEEWIATVAPYRLGLFEIMLYPFPWNLANDLYHLFSFALVLVGLAAWSRKGWNRFVTLFAVSYVAMMIALPVYGSGRYLWPIAPLVLFGMLNGAETTLRLLVPRLTPAQLDKAVIAIAIVLALASTATLASTPREQSLVEDPDVQEIVRHVRAMGPENGPRIAFRYPRLLTWETRVPAMGLPLPHLSGEGAVDRFIEELRAKRITHVIALDDTPPSKGEVVLRQALQERPTTFALVHQGSRFSVYEIE